MGAQNQNPGGSMPNYNGFLSPQAGNMGPAQAQSPSPSPSPEQLSQLVQLLTQGQGQQVPPQAAQVAQVAQAAQQVAPQMAQQQVAPQMAQQQQTMRLLQQAMALRAKARGAGQINQPGVRQY